MDEIGRAAWLAGPWRAGLSTSRDLRLPALLLHDSLHCVSCFRLQTFLARPTLSSALSSLIISRAALSRSNVFNSQTPRSPHLALHLTLHTPTIQRSCNTRPRPLGSRSCVEAQIRDSLILCLLLVPSRAPAGKYRLRAPDPLAPSFSLHPFRRWPRNHGFRRCHPHDQAE